MHEALNFIHLSLANILFGVSYTMPPLVVLRFFGITAMSGMQVITALTFLPLCLSQDKVDPDNIKEAMEELDKNHDGEVNFREFSQCIAGLARAYYTKKHGKDKCRGKGRGCQDK